MASTEDVGGTVLLESPAKPAVGSTEDEAGTVLLESPASFEGTVKLSAEVAEEGVEATVMLAGGGRPDASDGTMRLEHLGEPHASTEEPGQDSTVALTMAVPGARGGTEVVSASRSPSPGGGRGGTAVSARTAAKSTSTGRHDGPAPPGTRAAQGGSGTLVIVLIACAVIAGVVVGLML